MRTMSKTITLSRQQLYDEIWQLSVAGVARKYNLNYSKLLIICKKENIPYPSTGYWAKKSLGKNVDDEVVALPLSDKIHVELPLIGVRVEKSEKKEEKDGIEEFIDEKLKEASTEAVALERTGAKEKDFDDSVLPFLDYEERKRVLQVAFDLIISDKKKLHAQLLKYKKSMDEWQRNKKENKGSQRYYNRHYDNESNEPLFFNEISAESQRRAFLILDALFCAVEKLGGHINDDLSLRVMADTVKIRIAESQDKVKHEITKQEARELVEYNDNIKRHVWASKPKIRKYDYIYNGKLRIVFSDGEYIRDTAAEKLEDRLGDVLLRLYEKSNDVRIQRERWEEEERRRKEEARRAEELRKRKEEEIQRTKALLNQAEDYRIACDIRRYIDEITRQKDMTPELSQWIEWAKKKADWYDPVVALEDEYLGKRDHSKSKEEKAFDYVKPRYTYW
ncbi:hypothetical protein QVN49_03850 [Megasphaera hexanoica]|nr:hypothetical protein [Megasphaera hexanoica]